MSRAARYAEAIHTRASLAIPGSVIAVLLNVVMASFAMLVTVGAAVAADPWWMRILAACLAPILLLLIVFRIGSLRHISRRFRLSPHGLAYDRLPVLPWDTCLGVTVDTSGEYHTLMLLLTPTGVDLLERHGFGHLVKTTPTHIRVERFRGCSMKVTARLLTEAIEVNRYRLGLEPLRRT